MSIPPVCARIPASGLPVKPGSVGDHKRTGRHRSSDKKGRQEWRHVFQPGGFVDRLEQGSSEVEA